MGFFTLTALINIIMSSALGLFVYFKNRKSLVNQTFFLFCAAVAVWSCSYFFWQISLVPEEALFWSRGLMAGAIFVPIAYLHFLLTLTKKVGQKRKILNIGYLVFTFFFFANFTSLFVKSVTPKLGFPFWPNPGTLFHPFLLLWLSYVLYSLYFLAKEIRISTGVKRTQLKYILMGTVIGYAGGITNYLLWYDIPVRPWGNWTVSLYLAIVAYAIVKYRLLDIKVVLTEFFVAAMALILLIQSFVAEPLWLKILNFGVFVLFLVFGYLLIRSVLQEIKYRERLQRAYAELKKLDVAKSEFISMASHQLRTPLSAIKGYISMVLEGMYGKAPEKMEKPLNNIFISNERLINIVNDLLNLSKIELGRMEVEKKMVQVEDLIDETYNEMKLKAEQKKLYFKWQRPKKKLTKIELDPLKIKQVILNVVDNAIRYTQRGGVIIKCKIENASGDISRLRSKYGKCKIMVKDTGEGLTKSEASKLFESFARGSAGIRFWTEGAGLGLYVARKYLELHKGRIWAESPGKGKGSTFYIELPLT